MISAPDSLLGYCTKQVTDIDDLDSLVDLEELERYGDILQFLVAERRSLVVLPETFSTQHLDERDQPQTVGEVGRQVGDVLVDRLEMLVRPACKAILLDELPLCVSGQITFLGIHRFHTAPMLRTCTLTTDYRGLRSGQIGLITLLL